jgi:AraC family transcriptional regulator
VKVSSSPSAAAGSDAVAIHSGNFGINCEKAVVPSLRQTHGIQPFVLVEIACAIAAQLQTRTSAVRSLVEELQPDLAARLIQEYVSARTPSFVTRDGLDRRRLSWVLDFIDANLQGDLTIARLAGIACLNRFHFARAIGWASISFVLSQSLLRELP